MVENLEINEVTHPLCKVKQMMYREPEIEMKDGANRKDRDIFFNSSESQVKLSKL